MTTSDQSSFTRAEPMGDGALERVRDRYTEQPVPPCSVCGRDLRVQRAGGGAATVWGCDGHEADPNDPGKLRQSPTWDAGNNHYERSLWTQYRPGDPEVLALLSRLHRAEKDRDAKAEARDWLPISSADGLAHSTRILLWWHGRAWVGYRCRGRGADAWVVDTTHGPPNSIEPTHWLRIQALTTPPTEEEGA